MRCSLRMFWRLRFIVYVGLTIAALISIRLFQQTRDVSERKADSPVVTQPDNKKSRGKDVPVPPAPPLPLPDEQVPKTPPNQLKQPPAPKPVNPLELVPVAQRTGLNVDTPELKLDGKPFRILSGAIHYFRVPHQYWRDRLSKLRAGGLNTVETYVAWNLHEPQRGKFDFTNLNYDLDIVKFITIAQELGLYVIFRPGPFICAEWEWGGLPSWLLQDPKMVVRSTYAGYMAAVDSYFAQLLKLIEPLQYKRGGPIIAVQIENEFGSYGSNVPYLSWLKEVLVKNGIKELLFTSDQAAMLARGSLPGTFMMVNFKRRIRESLDKLKAIQPNAPLMVAEYWTGWFDYWGNEHSMSADAMFKSRVEEVLAAGASLNMYMYHGGTNFGFTNGATRNYASGSSALSTSYAVTTSYDYDSPISESGELTGKWHITRDIISKQNLNPLFDVNAFPIPADTAAENYGEHSIEQSITLSEMLDIMEPKSVKLARPEFMERICRVGNLSEPSCQTQNFGFIAYRKTFQQSAENANHTKPVYLRLHGIINDYAHIIINNRTMLLVNQTLRDASKSVHYFVDLTNASLCEEPLLDVIILVENMGRINYGEWPRVIDGQYKGFSGRVYTRGNELVDWNVFHLDFTADFWSNLELKADQWKLSKPSSLAPPLPLTQPAFFRTQFTTVPSKDTFLDSKGWSKGVAFINKFNLGRYWFIGPQRTLYLPSVKLKEDSLNEVILFELYQAADKVSFIDSPVLWLF